MRNSGGWGSGVRGWGKTNPQPLSPISPAKRLLLVFAFFHACPSTFFLYGQPFYAQKRFGWAAGPIGLTQALTGLCVAIGSYVGGQVAHRRQPRLALIIGLSGSICGALIGLAGALRGSVASLIPAMIVLSFSQAMAWPGIEAALMRDETHEGVQHLVGFFNLTWSFGTATAFLAATPLMNALGLNALFTLPAAIYAANLLFLCLFVPEASHPPSALPSPSSDLTPHPPSQKRSFLAGKGGGGLDHEQRRAYRWQGWIANPLAYLAIIVILTYNPTVSLRLGLSFREASVWCSLWFYARTAAFEILRRWAWWHYRRGFLYLCFVITMGSFAAIVLAPTLAALLVAQVVFGLSAGLLYQSSLFYSMAGSEAQGEHGGFHEGFIGLGTMLGPLLAFGGSRLFPNSPALSVGLVLGLMALGLCGMLFIGRNGKVQNVAGFHRE
jgi:MFS family permease